MKTLPLLTPQEALRHLLKRKSTGDITERDLRTILNYVVLPAEWSEKDDSTFFMIDGKPESFFVQRNAGDTLYIVSCDLRGTKCVSRSDWLYQKIVQSLNEIMKGR